MNKVYFSYKGEDKVRLSPTYHTFASLQNAYTIDLVERTEVEYNNWILLSETYPMISQDNIYQSAHKNAENNTLNLLQTQISEIQTTLLLNVLDGRIPSDYTITIVKLRNLESYSKELSRVAIERQAYIKEQMENGIDAEVAEKQSLINILITDTNALVGKHLHTSYVNDTITIPIIDKYKQDTIDVEYSTHLSEDEGEQDEQI